MNDEIIENTHSSWIEQLTKNQRDPVWKYSLRSQTLPGVVGLVVGVFDLALVEVFVFNLVRAVGFR